MPVRRIFASAHGRRVSLTTEGSAIMGGVEGIVALVIGLAVVLFVPALVWATVIAGLIQIVRDKIRETHPTQTEPAQEAQQPLG
jgi:hypothetical protein